MSTHTGAVTVVRFSPNGRYLASGSDDRVVLIWERDESRVPQQEFGSQGEVDTEVWVARKRLVGHDNDVQDLAWAPDSSLLVTVGLDSSIIIWSGTTFERLKRIDAHQSHVKGITFDPARKYFATSSDDRTVRIIRYHKSSPSEITFSIESTISSPFIGSPISTYFRRLSWSPDGNHIAASNATNGPVPTIAIVNRGTWDSDISLIGHEAPVEIASFCPRVFLTQKPMPGDNLENASPVTVVATAGQDKTLAVWNTSNPRPLLVARNVAEKAITDIVWSPDGTKMYASSLDGSILIASFEEGELGWPLGIEETQKQLMRYGGHKDEMLIPESVEQLVLEEKIVEKEKVNNVKKMDEIMGTEVNGGSGVSGVGAIANATANTNATAASITANTTANTTVNTVSTPNTHQHTPAPTASPKKPVQKITITKDGKKRVAPQLLTTSSLESRPLKSNTTTSLAEPHLQTMELSNPSYNLPKGGIPSLVIGTKRKAAEEEQQPETNGTVKKTAGATKKEEVPEFIRPTVVCPATTVSQVRLGVPKVQTFFGHSKTGSRSVLEIRNGTGNEQEPTKVTVSNNGQVVFVDFLSRYGHLAAGDGTLFWAVGTEDGVIHVYSGSGRKIMPSIVLGCSISFLEYQGVYLLAITSIGMVYIWNIKQQKAVHAPVSLAPILDTSSKYAENGLLRGPNISQCGVTNKGHIIITLTNGQGYTYNKEMLVWQRITESWYAFGSQYWDSNGLPGVEIIGVSNSNKREDSILNNNRANRKGYSSGLIAFAERRTNEEVVIKGGSRGRNLQRLAKNRMLQEGYEGFEGVVSLSHLETRITSAILLESGEELRSFLITYVKRISEEGMKDRLEEICKELLEDTKICDINKKDLLKEVIFAVGKIREVQDVVLPFARALGMTTM